MTADYPCECKHKKDKHRGGTYWCLVCECKRYTPDIQRAANVPPVMPGGESTSVLLRQAQTALAASQADLTRVEQERDLLAARVDSLAPAVDRIALLAAELASARTELEQLRAATDTHRTEGGTDG